MTQRPDRPFIRRRWSAWLACAAMGLAVLATCPRPVQAEEASAAPKMWVGLVKADATPPDGEKMEKLAPKLKAVFGYPNYHLLHRTVVSLDKPWEQWVLPSKEFYLKIVPMGDAADGTRKIHFELYRDKTPLIQAEYRMTAGRPLFVRGPQYQDGELIFVLRIADPEKPKS